MSNLAPLVHYQGLFIRQRRELAELFGFESRNKYEILSNDGQPVLYAAEQGKGGLAILARMFVGHWRTFEFHIFDLNRNVIARAVHPFRWFFQRLEVFDGTGRSIGALQQRWAFFAKRFDVVDAHERVLFTVNSPVWKPWTFAFLRNGQAAGLITKKWGGVVREMFTDADTFHVDYQSPQLTADERALLLAAGLFIDLQYFERKAD
jgi:uncharacterized protein YxjI